MDGKVSFIYTMEYYSAMKKNEIVPFGATWMDLELLSEINYNVNTKKYYELNEEGMAIFIKITETLQQ